MNITGKLRSRVDIQSRSTTQDAIGQPVETWTTFATAWAHIRVMGGLEAIKAGAVTSTLKASIRIRYRTGIDAGMRVLHGGVVYQVLAVLPDVAGREFIDVVAEVN